VVVDEWTRDCLPVKVAEKLDSDDILELLSWLEKARVVSDR
jgi:hypothetical protein